MPRAPRRAPKPDPMDRYSVWNRRVARSFFFSTVIGTLIIVLGIWVTILWFMAEQGIFTWFEDIEVGYIVALVLGIIIFHVFLLILFYILFRGGKERLLKILFKDREIAKKYEDYTTLRILVGLLLWLVFITVVVLIITLLPAAFGQAITTIFMWMALTFNPGQWILWVGAAILIGVGIIFGLFVLWNKGVYWVLKRVVVIEEERDIKEEIDLEKLQNMSEAQLHDVYKKETGKNAIYRGKETKGYLAWKSKKGL